MKNVMKRITAISLTAALAVTVPMSLAASAETQTAQSQTDGYDLTKISHPDRGSGEADGIVDYIGNGAVTIDPENGEGDRGQNYSWSSVSYGDYVYIGTNYGSMTSTLSLAGSKLDYAFDSETMTAALNAMFRGSFYTGEPDGGDTKGTLVKINVKTGETKIIMSKSMTGDNVAFRNGVVYNDKIYFCGAVNVLPCVYEIDPETDEHKLIYTGVSMEDYVAAYKEGLSVGIRGICEYDGKLAISCMGLNGAFIATSDHPSDGQDAFDIIANMDDLFGYPAYHFCDSIYGGSIWDMVEFNDKLYVSICTGTPDNMPDDNTMQSFAIVVGEKDENGNMTWRALAGDQEKDGARYTFGIDPERTRSGAANFQVYDDYLYIGEYNDEEIAILNILFDKDFDFMNENLNQSVNLYRMDKDENVELVVGDADKMFPDGSLSGIGSGFGRNENQYIWKMCEYNGKLYVGTFDTSSLLEPIGQFVNGDLANLTTEEWQQQIDYIKTLLDIINSKRVQTPDQPVSKAAVMKSSASAKNLSAKQLNDLADIMENNDFTDVNIEDKDIEAFLKEIQATVDELQKAISDKDSDKIQKLYDILVKYYEQFVKLVQEHINENDQNLEGYKTLMAELQKIIAQLKTEETKNMILGLLENWSYLEKAERGFDLYVSGDGIHFDTITIDGFGDPYNHGLRTTAVTDEGLAIGTANPFYGTQVWLIKDNTDNCVLMGDVNGDGRITAADALYTLQSIAGTKNLTSVQMKVADVNGDGRITASDALEVQRFAAGVKTTSDVGKNVFVGE